MLAEGTVAAQHPPGEDVQVWVSGLTPPLSSRESHLHNWCVQAACGVLTPPQREQKDGASCS